MFGMSPNNARFTPELVYQLIHTPAYRYDAYVDKNGMQLLAGNGAGAAALTAVSYPQVALDAFEALDAGVNPLLVLPLVFNERQMAEFIPQLLDGVPPALLVLLEFGVFATLNDGAKVTKFLNRAQQGGSWNEAYTEVLWQGQLFTRRESAMRVVQWPKETWVPATEEDEVALLNELIG